MGRRVAHLTLDNLDDIPQPCRSCVFWELDPVRRDRARRAGETEEEKEAWVSRVLLEWGSCGRIVYVDDQPAGFAIYAPAAFVPGADTFSTAPVSEDAVLLTTVRVLPGYTGGGLGRVLVQSVAKDLIERGGIRAIEAFGDRRGAHDPDTSAHLGCVVPAEFLLRVGFKTHRRHARYPRMRLDLKSALTWRDELEQALERLLGAVRAPRPVRPATDRVRGVVGTASRRVRQTVSPRRSAARSSPSRSTPVLGSVSGER